MKKPSIRIELTMHPEAKDGDRNAWLMEMFSSTGEMVMAQTADNSRACLDVAQEFLETGSIAREQTFHSPLGASVLRFLHH